LDYLEGVSFYLTCTIPHEIFEEINTRSPSDETQFFVDIYRTVGVDDIPDVSQFFLVKSHRFDQNINSTNPLVAPIVLVFDDEISDFDIESQLPLYTNPAEEGPLKENSLAPVYQDQLTKNGTNFLASLKKKKIFSSSFESFDVFTSIPATPSVDFLPLESELQRSNQQNIDVADPGSIYIFNGKEIFDEISFTSGQAYYQAGTGAPGSKTLISTISGTGTNNIFLLITLLEPDKIFLAIDDGVYVGTQRYLRFLNDIPSIAATPVFACPLLKKDTITPSISKITNLFFNFFPSPTTVFEKNTISKNIYNFYYRPLNLVSKYVIPFLPSGWTTDFRAFSFSTLYYQTIFQNSLSLKVNISVENKDFLTTPSDFPSWGAIEANSDVLGNENFPFHIAYSKPLEPTAFPPLNFLTVGTTKNQIHSLFKIRDSIIICSSEGFYRLTGDFADDFAITLIDDDYVSLSPLLNQEINETVYSFSDRGFVAISESNIVRIDYGIQNLVNPILNLNLDFSSLNSDQIYSSVKKEDDEIIWFFPNINENRILTSTSEIGLVFHTLSQNWSTINRTQSGSELIWISNNEDYSVQSSQKSDLNLIRKNLDRSDFCLKEIKSALRQEISTNSVIIENTSVLNITFNFNHELQIGDLVTIESFAPLSFFGSGVTESDFLGVFPISILDEKNISINLSITPLITLTGLITLKLGARGLKGTLSLSSGSSVGSIVFSRLSDDTNWSIGDKIYVNTPWQANLISSLANESDLLSLREITGLSPLTFNLSSNAISNFSEEIEFSKETRQPLTQSFQAPTNTFLEDDFAFLEKPNKVLYPFSFEKRQSDNLIQGFLERPFDPQKKLIRPSLVYTGLKSSVLTSKITGGNPAVLKAFEEVIMIPQNQWSSSYVTIAFQSDRFFSTQKTEMKSQTDLLSPFSPTFGEIIWSSLFSQWQDFTAIKGTFDLYQISPTIIMRLNVPIDVTQSTWLAVYLLHERPFETFAMGTISTTGTFLTPIGVG
jgi:hypothetical protein